MIGFDIALKNVKQLGWPSDRIGTTFSKSDPIPNSTAPAAHELRGGEQDYLLNEDS